MRSEVGLEYSWVIRIGVVIEIRRGRLSYSLNFTTHSHPYLPKLLPKVC